MKIVKYILLCLLVPLFTSCFKGIKVDLIIHNGKVHIMNDALEMAEAIAIQDGKIIEVGPERQILNKYRADVVINAEMKDVFPGFHDAHGHIFSLARQMMNVDLRGSRSYYEVISRLEKHQSKMQQDLIIGRGWDQSLWGEEELPDNTMLNDAFPTIPVALTRIDGHAMLINQAMMDFIGITSDTHVEGGDFLKKEGELTGLILDYAIDLVNDNLPKIKKENLREQILIIQDQLLASGITHLHEAGITAEERDLLIEMSEDDALKINIYAMLFPTPENIEFAKTNGHFESNHLSIRSFKIIADGALGSRGACLLSPYSDSPDNYGMLLKSTEELQRIYQIGKELNYQVNAHCIGDSANRTILKIVDTLMAGVKEHRFRIEHAQIVNPNDFELYAKTGILPSVQPTHAVSDYRWAENRLGIERLQGAYAYKTLQKHTGMILFGTDFPIENYDPFATIFAATQRKNTENEPQVGFLTEEAVSLDIALKAMTLWPSYGCFAENSVGTIRKGRQANLTILDQPMRVISSFQPNYAWLTLVDGKTVFDMR